MKYRSNMFMRRAALLLLAISPIAACNRAEELPPISGEVTFELSDTLWTYFSFESGAVVGTSRFGDEAQDEAWRVRLDWDIAFCGDLVRTNSGTSGIGQGGILRERTSNFYNLTEAPAEGYETDTDDFPVF